MTAIAIGRCLLRTLYAYNIYIYIYIYTVDIEGLLGLIFKGYNNKFLLGLFSI